MPRIRFGLPSGLLVLSEGVRLRTECFGGLVFDRRTGTTLEVDREAMRLLLAVRARGVVREDQVSNNLGPGLALRTQQQCARVVSQLLQLGVLTALAPAGAARRGGEKARSPAGAPLDQSIIWPPGPGLSAPETVHWAITYGCAANCPDCYARRHRGQFAPELDTDLALTVIDALAEWGVFQLAIGGGEPLQRRDLAALAARAHRHGLIVHVTTGHHDVPPEVLEGLAAGVTVLQFGVRHEVLLGDAPGELASLSRSVEAARSVGLRVGANLMLSSTVLASFERLIALLAEAGLTTVTLLRYKPPAARARWRREKPSPEALRRFERLLPEVMSCHPEVDVRVDCAASFLQRHLPTAAARRAGIRGCVAGDRILALTPDGTVFPCSQLVQPHLRAGNLVESDVRVLWSRSAVMHRCRFFREGRTFRGSECSVCGARDHCGGCRLFAADHLGAEPVCPAAH